MKKIGLFTMVAILLAALATGCSKSESDGDSNIKEKMENQQLINSIRQHIVGTWVHDGDCRDVYSFKTPYNEIILKDDLTFEKSENDTFAFTADGRVKLIREENGEFGIWEYSECDGTWQIISDVINVTGDDLVPPYGVVTLFDSGNWSRRGERWRRIFFSSDYEQMFLYSSYGWVLRYKRK